MSEKNPKFDDKNMRCLICGATHGVIHKYELNICRRCFRENAEDIGFKVYC